MARRKPIAKVGDRLIVEGIDYPLTVLEVALTSIVDPRGARKVRMRRSGYAYKVKMKRGKPQWVYEFEVDYVVRYNTLVMEVSRHAELVQSLGGYESLRDFVDSLPRTTRNSYTIRELARLVEYCALFAEGTSQEHTDAEAEIISIMQ